MSIRLNRGAPWVLAMGLCACSSSGPGPDQVSDGFDRAALLASLGQRVIVPIYADFESAATALERECAAYAGKVAAGEDASAERNAAQIAWRSAMNAWQYAELFQIGPAGGPQVVTGGQGLRDEIYSWPTISHCRVDQETVEQAYPNADFFDKELVNVYGLDALEYLLFVDTPDNACPQPVPINRDGTWAALGETEIAARRAAYAARVAEGVSAQAQALMKAWDSSGGNFLEQWSTAGSDGSPYPTAQQAVDELFAAMFYLDLQVKDKKLGTPLGLSPDCITDVCPELLESPVAAFSREAIEGNLIAFRALFDGHLPSEPDAIGFDDFLEVKGAQGLSAEIQLRLDESSSAASLMSPSMETSLVENPNVVREVHAKIKMVTDLLKSQFVSVLNLKLPDEGDADND